MENSVAPKTPLGVGEFAIKQAANFVPKEGQQIVVSKEGTLTITYRLENFADLIVGTGQTIDFNVYGVFKVASTNNYVEGAMPQTITLDTLSTATGNRIILKSTNDRVAFNVVTDADKREVGIEKTEDDK